MRKNAHNRVINKDIPYKSQWESPSLAEKILNKEISASQDPLWFRSGATTPKEYEYWSWNICGMACLTSILGYLKVENVPPLVQLAKRCSQFGGYVPTEVGIDGLYYKSFIDFIAKEFNLEGKIGSPLNIKEIIEEISQKNFVIVSVHPTIRNPRAEPPGKGGHLILIVGYDLVKEQLIFHNPSGYASVSQAFTSIDFSDFDRFFARRGIIINNPTP